MSFQYKSIRALLIVLIGLINSSCNGVRDLDEIKESDTLNVVMCYNPLGYYHQEDSTKGVQNEMIKAFCKELGINAKIEVQDNLEESIKGLEDGKYDIAAQLLPVTSELKEKVQFTNSICKDKQVLVQRKRTKDQKQDFIKSQLEIPGHCISMPKNSPFNDRLKNLAQEIGDTIEIDEIDKYQSEQLIILVAQGDLDYTVCNYNLAKQLGEKYPQLDYSTAISFTQMQAWAVNKKSVKLLEAVNKWIDNNADKYFK